MSENDAQLRTAIQKLLRDFRNGAGLRQSDVAELLGQPQSVVSKYETGERRVEITELIALCECFGITPQEFFTALDAELSET